MSKWFYRIITLLLVIGFIAGCTGDDSNENGGNDSNPNEESNMSEVEETVVIVLSEDDGENVITEEEIEIQEGDILMDVMKDNFEIEEEGGFIQSIEGIAPEDDEPKAWMYFVNGEMPTVGANEYELVPGDEIIFDFQSWE